MRVAIEARALSSQGGGVNRYVRNLLIGLCQHKDELSCFPIYDSSGGLKVVNEEAIIVKRYGDIGLWYWLNRQVEAKLKEMTVDVVHYTKADVPRRKKRATVVTIYDIIPLLFPTGQKISRRWYWPKALARAAEQSDHIITISKASKRDISETLQVDPQKITVTPLGVDERLRSDVKAWVPEKPYILFVGTIEPRKNVGGLIRAFANISDTVPHQLVIAGRQEHEWSKLVALSKELGLDKRIEWKGFVTEAELKQLYSGASLFVWPSIYEGWGLPPQEAMASGVPVIVSNGGALPEVVGDGGIIVNYYNNDLRERLADKAFEEDLSREIVAILTDPVKSAEIVRRGIMKGQNSGWEEVATKTIEVYKMIAG